MTKDQLAAIAFADAYMLDVGLTTYTQLLEGLSLLMASPYGPERDLNYEALTRPIHSANARAVVHSPDASARDVMYAEDISARDAVHGVRCHNDACCAGQLPCPSPAACGVAS